MTSRATTAIVEPMATNIAMATDHVTVDEDDGDDDDACKCVST
jgi:hypothetical protein